MKSIASTTAVRQPEFVVAHTSECVSPYMMGVLDAQAGELCVPEMYYTQRGQMCEYAEGYEAVAGKTLLSTQILGTGPVTDAQIDAAQEQAELDMETVEYIEDQLDREFWARGQW